MLLGRIPPDWDLAIDLGPEKEAAAGRMREVLGEIVRELGGRFVFHSRFLTGTVFLNGQSGKAGPARIDICHTREEFYPRPAVLPRVAPAPIERDLFRRDFTINAIAWELSPGGLGKIVDPFHGQDDLKARLVRVLHPNSFIDDPTRIFRAIRFAIRLDYEIESGTLYLLRRAVVERYPARLTPERILYELRCIVLEPAMLRIMEALVREGVLMACWEWRMPRDFFVSLQRLVANGVGPQERFGYLLSVLPVTEKFPITREEREVQAVLRRAEAIERQLKRVKRRETIYRLLHGLPVPALRVMMALNRSGVGRKIAIYLRKLVGVRAELTARDLLTMGFEPGPKLGRVLQQLLLARLAGRVRTRADEVRLVMRWRNKGMVSGKRDKEGRRG